jgi:hypothetical protein
MPRRITTKNLGLLAKSQALLLGGIIAGALVVLPADSFARKSAKVADPPCSLSQNAAGNLVVTSSGLAANTTYAYQIYSEPEASVGGGELTTDASGNLNHTFGAVSWYMSVYRGETTLTFVVYPIIGNKANVNTVVSSCSITP